MRTREDRLPFLLMFSLGFLWCLCSSCVSFDAVSSEDHVGTRLFSVSGPFAELLELFLWNAPRLG